MKKLRARTGTILVSMLSQDTTEDGKHSIDPETGLLLGREVHQPIGVVVSSGVEQIPTGSKVVTVCDLGEQYKWQGMAVQMVKVAESCQCGRAVQTSADLAAYKLPSGGQWLAAPGKVLAQLAEREQASDDILAGQVNDGVEMGTDCADTRAVYFPGGAGIRWSEGCVTYVSLSDEVRCKCGRVSTGQLIAENSAEEGKKDAEERESVQVVDGQKGQKRPKKGKKSGSEAQNTPAMPQGAPDREAGP